MPVAFNYMQANFLIKETVYPYTHKVGTCQQSSKAKTTVKAKGHAGVTHGDPTALKASIAKGPTSVSICSKSDGFMNYKTGVITGTACGTNLDHGVLAVGYGVENNKPYYLVKNSWAASWGDKGYVKIGIAAGDGVCGI
jgi:cathepsin L